MIKQKILKLVALLCGLSLYLIACVNKIAENKPVDNSETSNITLTSPIPDYLATSNFDFVPTATLISEASVQPTPIIFVPIATFTPAPPTTCPKINDKTAMLNIGAVSETFDQSYEQPILDFLNNGGSINILGQELHNRMDWFNVKALDLSNDTVPEVVVEANGIYVLGCSGGLYHSLLVIPPIRGEYSPTILAIKDMNLDGVSELVIARSYGGQTPMRQVQVLEWNGVQFQNLLAKDNVCSRNFYAACVLNGVPDIMGGVVTLVDIENGTTKLVITGGVELGSSKKPVAFSWIWNGNEFILSNIDLPSP